METKHEALHASAPADHKCADCYMDKEPCPACYEAWWKNKYPNTFQLTAKVIPGQRKNGNRSIQERTNKWLVECLGQASSDDKIERSYRFIEEALELVQACGLEKGQALAVLKYVYSRPIGEVRQEVGGVAICLSALCTAHGLSMYACGDIELDRCYHDMEKIRQRQAEKRERFSSSIGGESIIKDLNAEDEDSKNAVGQQQMPDTERRLAASMGNQPACKLDDAGNERPSGGLSLNAADPAAPKSGKGSGEHELACPQHWSYCEETRTNAACRCNSIREAAAKKNRYKQ